MTRRTMRRSAALLAFAFLTDASAQGIYGHLYEPGALPLDEIIGMEVLTPEGRPLGRITDLIVERATGTVEEVAVGAARYPVRTLISGDTPGRLVVLELPQAASAGATALLPISAGSERHGGQGHSRASRDLGTPEGFALDLREGRVRPVQ